MTEHFALARLARLAATWMSANFVQAQRSICRSTTTAHFSVCGDGHAAQGDGEVCINGIECPLDVTLRFRLHKHQPLSGPLVESSDSAEPDPVSRCVGRGRIGHGRVETARAATNRMIDLLVSRWHFSEIHAYLLCSVAMRLRLSQVVNEPVYTVSAALPKRILPRKKIF